MKQISFRATIIVTLAWVTGHCPMILGQELSDSLKDWFLREAPSRWEEYRNLEQSMQQVITYRSFSSERQNTDTIRLEYRVSPTARLLVMQWLDGSQTRGEVLGFNPKYSFILSRKSVDDPWIVEHLDMTTNELPEHMARRINRFANGGTGLVSLQWYPLPEVIREPNFQVKKVARKNHNEEELIEVEFDWPHDVAARSPEDFNPIQGGRMLLDPKRFWTIRELELQLKTLVARGTYKRRNDIDKGQEIPVPKHVVTSEEYNLNSGGQMVLKTETVEMSFKKPKRPPPDRDFSLSAFGLPEPLGVSWSRTPWYLWVALAGILFLLIGAGFYWLKRRRQAAGS
jgi:hypothetical protein